MKTLKLLLEEMILPAKAHARISPVAPSIPMQPPGVPYLSRTLNAAEASLASSSSASGFFFRNRRSVSARREVSTVLIYLVDDQEGLIELYTLFLKGTGCIVRAFNHRAAALTALKKDRMRPDLLILDYLGHSMPVDRFLQGCRAVHPSLCILIASGFDQSEVRFSQARPDRFIQKPFTAQEFLQEVSAALTA